MTRESKTHIEQQNVILYQPMLDEQTVRKAGGIQPDGLGQRQAGCRHY